MSHVKHKEFGAAITRLINKQNLSRHEAKNLFSQILLNEQPEIQQGAFLAALNAKGETAAEIAGSWEAIYELDTVKVKPDVDAPLVENSGTGMDSLKTFNISTAASIIAAAGGVIMARHGARAITSSCGTVDMLEMLGVDVECEPEIVKTSIEQAGIGIFNGMSPKIHPQALGRILSQIHFGTTLNIAASLANPALPEYGVRGVYTRFMVEPVARVMREIGYKKALVVHGLSDDGVKGMDEASTVGETVVCELKEDGTIVSYSFMPGDIGIPKADLDMLYPSQDREKEALRLLALLNGKDDGARVDIVCLNAALILYIAGASRTIKEGFVKAKEIIKSGQALEKLRDWVRYQNSDSTKGIMKLEKLLGRCLDETF